MDKIQKLKQEKQYEQYVKEKTPRHNLFLNMCKAFFLGGLICLEYAHSAAGSAQSQAGPPRVRAVARVNRAHSRA